MQLDAHRGAPRTYLVPTATAWRWAVNKQIWKERKKIIFIS